MNKWLQNLIFYQNVTILPKQKSYLGQWLNDCNLNYLIPFATEPFDLQTELNHLNKHSNQFSSPQSLSEQQAVSKHSWPVVCAQERNDSLPAATKTFPDWLQTARALLGSMVEAVYSNWLPRTLGLAAASFAFLHTTIRNRIGGAPIDSATTG